MAVPRRFSPPARSSSSSRLTAMASRTSSPSTPSSHSTSRRARSPGPAYYGADIWTGPLPSGSRGKYTNPNPTGRAHASAAAEMAPPSRASPSRTPRRLTATSLNPLAAESKERKDAEANRIRQDNLDLQRRLDEKVSATDTWMDTEAAAVARGWMAEQSKFRREADALEAIQRNEEMRRRLKSIQSVTDDDINTARSAARRAVPPKQQELREQLLKGRRKASSPRAKATAAAKCYSPQIELVRTRVHQGLLLTAEELEILEAEAAKEAAEEAVIAAKESQLWLRDNPRAQQILRTSYNLGRALPSR